MSDQDPRDKGKQPTIKSVKVVGIALVAIALVVAILIAGLTGNMELVKVITNNLFWFIIPFIFISMI